VNIRKVLLGPSSLIEQQQQQQQQKMNSNRQFIIEEGEEKDEGEVDPAKFNHSHFPKK
jgi:hypothetical protein